MYILNASLQNIRRYAGRYALFGALLLAVLAVAAVVSVAELTIDTEFNCLMQKYGATAVVKKGGFTEFQLSVDELSAIAELPQVEELQTTRLNFGIFTDTFTLDGQTYNPQNQTKSLKDMKLSTLQEEKRFGPILYATGFKFDIDPQVNDNSAANYIIEGRFPIEENEVMLNLTLVEGLGFTDIGIGSLLSLNFGGEIREYEVVGLGRGIPFSPCSIFMRQGQCIFVLPYAAAEQLHQGGTLDNFYMYMDAQITMENAPGERRNKLSLNAFSGYISQFLLNEPSQFKAFQSQVKQLSSNYTADLAYASATQLVTAYESTSQICTFFLTAVIAISAVVILIMTALAMHERRYEIGVLLSVGMSKPRIAALFAVENLIFTLGVTVLAYAVGLAAAPFAADLLLEGVVEISRSVAALPVAARMLALAVGLSLPASFISSLAILAYKPMTILRSRS